MKVLIVEDNPASMRLIRMALRKSGYRVLEAADGLEALAVARRERPDLIVMDVRLPKMDGLEATRRLRQTPGLGRVPIIALTASAMEGDRQRIIAAGCDEYIAKPFNTRQFPDTVARILARAGPVADGEASGQKGAGYR